MPRASLRSLQVYCTTAELGSFKRAAEALFVTPSAVSHQVKSLEEQLGRQLFERQTRGVQLTAAGRELLAAVGPLLQQLDAAVDDFATEPQRQRITIAMPPFFSTEFFIPRLPDIARDHPSLDIRLVSASSSGNQFPREAELAIVLAERPPADVSSLILFPLTLVPVAAPSLTLTRSALVDTHFDIPLIIHRTRRNAWQRWFKREGKKIAGKLKVIEMDSMFAVARAAEQGLGVALVPVVLVQKWVASGAMDMLCEKALPTKDRYFLCWRGEDRPPFLDSIAESLAVDSA